MRTTIYAIALLAIVVFAGVAPAQAILSTTFGTGMDQFLGASVAPIGDLDGDGVPDLLVGAPENPNSGEYPSFIFTPPASTAPTLGRVEVFSGALGGVISTIVGPSLGESFGHAVLSPGDLNGDGVPDVVVGAPTAPFDGFVHVFSGSSLTPLYAASSPPLVTGGACLGFTNAFSLYGYSLDSMGDVNGDGTPDFVVGAPVDPFGGQTQPQCVVRSGIDGGFVLTACGPALLPFAAGFDIVGGVWI